MKHTTLLTKLTEYGEACEEAGFRGRISDYEAATAVHAEVLKMFEDIRSKEFSLILDQKIEISALKAKVNNLKLKKRCRK